MIRKGKEPVDAVSHPPVPRDIKAKHEQSTVGFVISANLRRRQLDPSQRAAVAVEIEPMFAAEAKVRQQSHNGTAPGKKSLEANLPQVKREPQARDQAASVVGVSGKMRSRQIHFSHTISNAIQCDCLKLSEHKRKII